MSKAYGKPNRVVIALGGNALLKRGEPMTAENQRENVKTACAQIARVYDGNQLIITHRKSACWRCKTTPTKKCRCTRLTFSVPKPPA